MWPVLASRPVRPPPCPTALLWIISQLYLRMIWFSTCLHCQQRVVCEYGRENPLVLLISILAAAGAHSITSLYWAVWNLQVLFIWITLLLCFLQHMAVAHLTLCVGECSVLHRHCEYNLPLKAPQSDHPTLRVFSLKSLFAHQGSEGVCEEVFWGCHEESWEDWGSNPLCFFVLLL